MQRAAVALKPKQVDAGRESMYIKPHRLCTGIIRSFDDSAHFPAEEITEEQVGFAVRRKTVADVDLTGAAAYARIRPWPIQTQ